MAKYTQSQGKPDGICQLCLIHILKHVEVYISFCILLGNLQMEISHNYPGMFSFDSSREARCAANIHSGFVL